MTNLKSAYEQMVRLLARRRYHSVELKKKLLQKGQSDKDISEAVERAIELKFINDSEYIHLYIVDQLRQKPQGLRLLKQRLIQKGIAKNEIERELEKVKIDEFALAKEALVKKVKTIKITTPSQQKEKLFRFLASRGFSQAIISKTIKEYF